MKARFLDTWRKVMQTIDNTPTTLQNCDDEAIHLIESVQSFGYVIAINPSTKKFRW